MKFVVICTMLYVVFLILVGTAISERTTMNLSKRSSYIGHMNLRVEDLGTRSDMDILIVGSSQVYRGYDPRIFKEAGLDVFVLGSSSQTPIQSLMLLERYLDQLSPDTVIMDVFPLTFMDEGVESAYDLLANDQLDPYTAEMAFRVGDISVWNSLIYRTFTQHVLRRTRDEEPIEIGTDRYIAGGYVESSAHEYRPRNTRTMNEWNPPGKQINAFRSIVRALERKNIPLILIHAPVTSEFRLSGEPLNDYRNHFTTQAEFHDLSDLFDNDTTYFQDQFHLNSKGVRAFNRHLIEILQKKGSI